MSVLTIDCLIQYLLFEVEFLNKLTKDILFLEFHIEFSHVHVKLEKLKIIQREIIYDFICNIKKWINLGLTYNIVQ